MPGKKEYESVCLLPRCRLGPLAADWHGHDDRRADVVIMAVRGITAARRGCEFELQQLVQRLPQQRLPQQRLVLVVDAQTRRLMPFLRRCPPDQQPRPGLDRLKPKPPSPARGGMMQIRMVSPRAALLMSSGNGENGIERSTTDLTKAISSA